MKKWLTGRNIFVLFCSSLFILGVYASFSESFQLSLIPVSHEGLLQTGRIVEKEGGVSRKLVNDVLWHPVDVNDPTFLGDDFLTAPEGSLFIELSQMAKAKIKISGGTQVKLRMKMNKPMIHLTRGQLDVDGDSAEDLLVTSGLKTQSIRVKKRK